MTKQKITYQLRKLVILIFVWELIFWSVFFTIFQSGSIFKSNNSSFFSFQEPKNLGWFWLIGVVIALFLFNVYQSEKIYQNAGNKIRLTIFKSSSYNKSFFSFFLFRNALAFLIIAMAQPAFGKKKVTGTVQSMELVISLDISNSMNTKDVDKSVSRLDISKRAINELINKLSGEKLGISVFAGEAYTQLPLTLDYYAAKMFVSEIETNMISKQGTNIKNALKNAYSMFTEDDKMSKAVILITDGENHEENPSEIIKTYKDKGVQLAVLGIGTKNGGLIPIDPNRPDRGFKRNALGVTIQSKLNPQFIQEIATEAGGVAMISDNAYPDLRGLLKQIAKMKRATTTGMDFEVEEQRYQIPLALSILFFIGYFLLPGIHLNFEKRRT